MSESKFRPHWSWIKWVAAAAILAWLYSKNRETLADVKWGDLRWGVIAAGGALCGVAFLITFTRWYLLVTAQDLPFRWQDSVRLGFLGILFTYVAPGAVGGDIVKAMLIAREQPSRKATAVASVVLDRILGLIALFIVGAAASLLFLPWAGNNWLRAILAVLWGGAGGGLVALILALHTPLPDSRFVKFFFKTPVIGKALAEIQQSFLLYHRRKRTLWLALGLSIVGHFGFLSVFYLASLSLQMPDVTPTYAGHLLLIPGAEVAGVVVPTPAGIGALEGAVQFVFQLWTQLEQAAPPKELVDRAGTAGLMTALIFRVIHMLTALVGAGFYFLRRKEIETVLESEPLELPVEPRLDESEST